MSAPEELPGRLRELARVRNLKATLPDITADSMIQAADALESAARQRAELQETLCYLGKWIERGMFCKTVKAAEAINVMAHYPGMPWNSQRWDVDHKPYAAAYYKAFPATAPKPIDPA